MATAMHCHGGCAYATLRWTAYSVVGKCLTVAVPVSVAKSEKLDSQLLKLPNSDVQASAGTALDLSESPDLLALTDAMAHMPPPSDISARIQALEATAEPLSISLDEIRQSKADDDSLRPVLQAMKDQTKLPSSDLRQYPENARILLSQWDSLILQEGVLCWKFHHPGSSVDFLQIVLPVKLHLPYIERLHTDLGHFGWTTACYAVSRHVYFLGWHSFTGLLVRNYAVCNLHQRS